MQERKIPHGDKWFMRKPESVLENETHEIHWSSEIQMTHKILAAIPNIGLIYKKKITDNREDFAVPAAYKTKRMKAKR